VVCACPCPAGLQARFKGDKLQLLEDALEEISTIKQMQ
jgi:hypothetical protein